jgi:hypothetical protein
MQDTLERIERNGRNVRISADLVFRSALT